MAARTRSGGGVRAKQGGGASAPDLRCQHPAHLPTPRPPTSFCMTNPLPPAPRPARQVAWQRLRQCSEDDVAVEGAVVATNRGGIIVEVENIRGFCPGSQLGQVGAARSRAVCGGAWQRG